MKKTRFRKTGSVLLVLLLFNALTLGLWHHEFPTIPLRILGSSHQVAKISDKPAPAVQMGSQPVGDQILTQLLGLVATPTGWERISTDPSPIAPALYTRCQNQILSPALDKSFALRKNNAGILVEIEAYSAGLGPKAFQEISSTVNSCSGFGLSGTSPLGTESIAVNDNGALNGSGSSGRTIWVRSGDVIGMISARGGNLYAIDKLISDWVTQWSTVLSSQACPNLNNKISDVSRSPLSNSYTGLTRNENVVLTDAQNTSALTEGSNLITQEASTVNATDLSIPTTALPILKTIPLISYPATVIPAMPPAQPIAVLPFSSIFPVEPSGEKIVGHFVDPVGPGCGWAFTGEQVPAVTSQSAIDATTSAIAIAQTKLMGEESQYSLAKWRYGFLYNQYVAQVDAWNLWAAGANTAIVNALWLTYDSDMIVYQTSEAVYSKANNAWLACIASNTPNATPSATPSPSDSVTPNPSTTPSVIPSPSTSPSPSDSPASTPVPSPSPSSSSTQVSCGIQPVQPIQPMQPSEPRNK